MYWTFLFLYIFFYLGYHTIYGILHILQDYLPSTHQIYFFSIPSGWWIIWALVLTTYITI